MTLQEAAQLLREADAAYNDASDALFGPRELLRAAEARYDEACERLAAARRRLEEIALTGA